MDPLGQVAIFWDIETCPLPERLTQTHDILNNIHDIGATEGRLVVFNAYTQDQGPRILSLEVQVAIQSRAVCLVKYIREDDSSLLTRIITDAWAFAAETALPATLIFISALTENPNFTYTISRLRWKRHKVLFVTPPATIVPESLRSQASALLDWNTDVVENAPNTSGGRTTEPDLSIPSHHHKNLNAKNNQGKYSPSLSFTSTVLASSKRSSRTAFENQTPADSATSWRRSPVIFRSPTLGGKRPFHDTPTENADDDQTAMSSTEKTLSFTQVPTTVIPTASHKRPQNVRRKSNEKSAASTSRHKLFSDMSSPSQSVSPTSLIFSDWVSGDVQGKNHSDEFYPAGDLIFQEHSAGSYPSYDAEGNRRDHGSLPHFLPINTIQGHFLPLIEGLEALRREGHDYPLRSLLGSRLGRTVYAQAGVANFNQYATLAQQEGLVQLGGFKGSAWISLKIPERNS